MHNARCRSSVVDPATNRSSKSETKVIVQVMRQVSLKVELGLARQEAGEMLSILLPSKQFLRSDQIFNRSDADPVTSDVDGYGPERKIVISPDKARWLENNVDQTGRGHEAKGDRGAEDVAWFEPAAVDPESFRNVIDPPSRAEGVQRVTQTLKVALRSFRDQVDVDGLEICALQSSGEAAENHIDDVMLVEHLAESAELSFIC